MRRRCARAHPSKQEWPGYRLHGRGCPLPRDARRLPFCHRRCTIAEYAIGVNVMKVLTGKVAVIVGGTSGIGARTAELLVYEGATVVIACRRYYACELLYIKTRSAA